MKREGLPLAAALLAACALMACAPTDSPVTPPVSVGELKGKTIQTLQPPATTNTVAKTVTPIVPVLPDANATLAVVDDNGTLQTVTRPDPEKIGDFLVVGFDRLASFKYEVPDDPVSNPKAQEILQKNQIPATIKQLDKKRVALKGYMLPLKVEGGVITELLILRDQSMCCYGAVPKINEWVSVRMVGKGVKPVMDVPVMIFGTLKVGEVLENGYLVGIYEMDGERLGGPLDL